MLVAIRVCPRLGARRKGVRRQRTGRRFDCRLALEMTKAHQRHWLGGQDIWLKDHRRFLLRHALTQKLSQPKVPKRVGVGQGPADRRRDQSALYGHTLRGRDLDTGATWTLVFAADGSFFFSSDRVAIFFSSDSRHATATSESGSIVEIGNAVMCWGYLISGGRGCGTASGCRERRLHKAKR